MEVGPKGGGGGPKNGSVEEGKEARVVGSEPPGGAGKAAPRLGLATGLPYINGMMIRRIVASVLLLSAVSASLEPVWGEMRDGQVHHETMAEAYSHAQAMHTHHSEAHRHPAVDTSDSHSHDDGSHPSRGDHCTHQHGTSIPTSEYALYLVDEADFPPLRYEFPRNEWTPPVSLDPPRLS